MPDVGEAIEWDRQSKSISSMTKTLGLAGGICLSPHFSPFGRRRTICSMHFEAMRE